MLARLAFHFTPRVRSPSVLLSLRTPEGIDTFFFDVPGEGMCSTLREVVRPVGQKRRRRSEDVAAPPVPRAAAKKSMRISQPRHVPKSTSRRRSPDRRGRRRGGSKCCAWTSYDYAVGRLLCWGSEVIIPVRLPGILSSSSSARCA